MSRYCIDTKEKFSWRYDLGKPHNYSKRNRLEYYYEFKQFKVYSAFKEEIKIKVSKEISYTKFEKYLIDKGYKRLDAATNKPFKFYSTIGTLTAVFVKDNVKIYYGIYEYGYHPNICGLFNYIDMINYTDEEALNITDVIVRIEKQFDFEFIEKFFVNGKKGKFVFDYNDGSITFIK